ncbi:CSS-motif domain-containing protein, partial [Klebsiella michiganensis]
GSPVLIQWSPLASDGNDGVMEVVNIDLITKMILEPQRPQITDVVLRVGDNFLRDGQQVTTTPTFDENASLLEQSSQHYPFSVTVSGPGPGEM